MMVGFLSPDTGDTVPLVFGATATRTIHPRQLAGHHGSFRCLCVPKTLP
jgi:hypothetical protein